jgi:hypothetical protein
MKRDTIVRMLGNLLPIVDPAYRADANETLAMARQLEHFFAKIYTKKFPDSKGRLLVPVNNEVNTGARSHTYVMTEEFGEARIIHDYAEDLPMVDLNGKEFTSKIVPVVAGFHFSLQDLRSAAMLGMSIDSMKATLARKSIERKIDQLICTGDAASGITGMANNANVPLATGLTGTWQGAAATVIQADIEKICTQLFINCAGTIPEERSVTIAVDVATYARLTTLRIDTFNMRTVLDYLLESNRMIKEIVSWSRLSKVASGGTARRLVAYVKDPDTLETIIPQEFEILPAQPRALTFVVPCHARFGGVKVVYPLQMLYADGT